MPRVVLISTYELGHQPFGLASPAAWLRDAGFEVAQLDLAQQKLDESTVRRADLVAFYLPMHTATRIALRVLPKVRELNRGARIAAYGLYAPMNEELLRSAGVEELIGGEFEAELVRWAKSVHRGDAEALGRVESSQRLPPGNGDAHAKSVEGTGAPHFVRDDDKKNSAPPRLRGEIVCLDRLAFRVPERAALPALKQYAHLVLPDGTQCIAGYTEASRGCKHLCRHCPIVPVYNGAFRIVQRDVVLEDILRQVGAGAEHITFGDPDFFNGPAHAMALVRELHREHPGVSYDVTIKVEHLLRHADLLPELRATGCAFVTTAVESFDDRVLALLDKGHTRADFQRLVELARAAGLPLAPTFIPFTPWTTLAGYAELLRTIAEHELVENVSPVQLAIRLLIPAGSRMLELDEVRALIGRFDPGALSYPWRNPDPCVDALQHEIETMVAQRMELSIGRGAIFAAVWQRAQRALNEMGVPFPELPLLAARATVPYLTEPWYC